MAWSSLKTKAPSGNNGHTTAGHCPHRQACTQRPAGRPGDQRVCPRAGRFAAGRSAAPETEAAQRPEPTDSGLINKPCSTPQLSATQNESEWPTARANRTPEAASTRKHTSWATPPTGSPEPGRPGAAVSGQGGVARAGAAGSTRRLTGRRPYSASWTGCWSLMCFVRENSSSVYLWYVNFSAYMFFYKKLKGSW